VLINRKTPLLCCVHSKKHTCCPVPVYGRPLTHAARRGTAHTGEGFDIVFLYKEHSHLMSVQRIIERIQMQRISCGFAHPQCTCLFVPILVSLLSGCSSNVTNTSNACAVGFAGQSTFQVQIADSFCGGAHLAIGTYVDTEESFGLSKVYIKSGSDRESTKYLYKVTTDTPSPSTWWYISTALHNTASEMYDIRWTIPNGGTTDVALIANSSASVKCNATENGTPSGSKLATVTLVTECKCDYNYGVSEDTCEPCPLNKYKNTISNDACTGCPWNLENAIITTCTCRPGSFQEGAQRVGETGGPCKQCAAGLYNEAGGSVQCTQCPANTSSPQNSDHKTHCICNIGFTGQNAGPCTLCPAGKYKDSSGDAPCTECEADQCSTATGATSYSACQDCTSNSMAPAGSDRGTACVCLAGWFGVNNTGCSKCPTDTYSDVPDSQTCTLCPAGHIAPSGGASADVCVCTMGSDAQCECASDSTEVYIVEVRVSSFV